MAVMRYHRMRGRKMLAERLRKSPHTSGIANLHFILRHIPYSVLDHAVTLGVWAARPSDVIVDMFGHGFLIASDSLTKHPSGPGIQPEDTISDFDWNRGRGVFRSTI